jgi:hypothetical protein
MHLRLLLIIIFTASAAAQVNLCNPTKASIVDQTSGVIVQKVTLRGTWGSNVATVFLPGKEIVDGAVLFSHSIIQSNNGASADMIPLALTLAQAGAAVIVPERTLVWPPKDQWTNREGAVVLCAEQWLRENTKVANDGKAQTNKDNVLIRVGYAYVGPRICDPGFTSECQLTSPFTWPSRHNGVKVDDVWVPLAEPSSGNPLAVPTSVRVGSFLARWLGLSPINRLVGDSQNLFNLFFSVASAPTA